ncbi:unnamed protein product [Ambrosiozyma monospora]|uniref:Unnamed protein product n=1 Tax=Ambrosiozyma monospora TaxID=43982 RepID=A0ACB5T0D8_AMBMO|nr:unnamed protein product [Ambrosiozyma monospora]
MSLDVKSMINQYMVATDLNSTQATSSVNTLVHQIENKQLSLLNFIKLLGDYLTDDSNTVRPKSLSLLSSTLDTIKFDKLQAKEVDVLVSFYSSKMEDPQCTKETLKGINALVSMKMFRPSVLKVILSDLKEKYESRGQLASTRYFAFLILQSIMEAKLEYCQTNFNDLFVETFLHVAKNEKDPKNLMISFKLNKAISDNFNVDKFSEDMFDSVYCYFPISFRAPENDPYKITGDQLKQALRDCLSAKSIYAKDSIPNLIEKLASTSPTVKLDVLKTLNQCIDNYDTKTIEEYWISLWNSLKFEILHKEIASAEDLAALIKYYKEGDNESERVIPIAWNIFQSMSNKYTDPKGQESVRDYLILIVDELSKYLKDSEDTKSRQSAVIMASICSANVNSFNLLIGKVMKLLITPISDPEQAFTIKKQRTLLSNVSFMLDAYYKLFNTDGLFVEHNNPIFEYKDIILTMVNQSLLATSNVEVTLRCLAIKIIGKLFTLKSFLTTEERQLLVQTLSEVLLEDDNVNTFKQALFSLNSISKEHPSIVLEFLIFSPPSLKMCLLSTL